MSLVVAMLFLTLVSAPARADQQVTEVQTLLSEHGHNPGPIDGIIGKQTRKAIRAFEQAHGLVVDGAIDETLMQCLRGDCRPHYTTPARASRLFYWHDESGASFATVETEANVNPQDFVLDSSGFAFELVDIESPTTPPSGWKATTYRVFAVETATKTLVADGKQATVYLIGETHVGASQHQVAKVLARLVREKEIDAILVEQPDDLSFKWQHFVGFEHNPQQAIAIMKEAMGTQSVHFLSADPGFGSYDSYFKDAEDENDLYAALDQIRRKEGEIGVRKAIHALQTRNSVMERHQTAMSDYEESRYISAADYFYVMANLKGVRLPFHPIESPELRADFRTYLQNFSGDKIPNDKLLPRDRYMVDSVQKLVSVNG
jgi:peptidoglycan hydrolase-like protein with peptidoglycan-binding domain